MQNACEIFPEGLPQQMVDSQGFKSLDPMTVGERLRKTSSSKILKHIRETSDPVLNSFFIWHRILAAYMECSLTKDEDKLVAISAIAKCMEPLVNGTYLAGLWVRYLPYHLLWRVWLPQPVLRAPDQSQPYIAPSWSWASVKGTCLFFDNIDIHQDRFMIRILETNAIPKGFDPMGQLVHSHIKLRCWLKSFTFRQIQTSSIVLDLGEDRQIFAFFDERREIYKELSFMPILECPDKYNETDDSIHGLILSKVETREEFQRVGIFSTVPFDYYKKAYWLLKRPAYGVEADDCQYENITADVQLGNVIINNNDPLDGFNRGKDNVTQVSMERDWVEAIIKII